MKRKGNIFLILVVIILGWSSYEYFRLGWHTRPEMPPGAFSLNFKNGLRAIMVGIPDERFKENAPSRMYIGLRAAGVPPWFEEAWSFCEPPTDKEAASINKTLELGPGMRLDAICKINPDGEMIITAYIYSAPKL